MCLMMIAIIQGLLIWTLLNKNTLEIKLFKILAWRTTIPILHLFKAALIEHLVLHLLQATPF